MSTPSPSAPVPAKLALADGTVFTGTHFGAPGEVYGEVVFNTSLTGYQEILTDPSYNGQIVTMTYPLIGNYGINPDDVESNGLRLRGFVIRELCRAPSNFRSQKSLDTYLKENNIVGIEGIDTRSLVRRIRSQGAMTGVLSSIDLDDASLVEKARTSPTLVGRDLVREVMPPAKQQWDIGLQKEFRSDFGSEETPSTAAAQGRPPRVVAIDYGMKWNIPRHLRELGCEVTIVPGSATAQEILELNPDGVFLSNGPGDPEPLDYAGSARKEADLRNLSGASVAGARAGGKDLQTQVWTPRGEPAGSEPGDEAGRNHLPESRVRCRCRIAPVRC
jgi:carbamoyl-phosphate synthase small subunit